MFDTNLPDIKGIIVVYYHYNKFHSGVVYSSSKENEHLGTKEVFSKVEFSDGVNKYSTLLLMFHRQQMKDFYWSFSVG